MRKNCPSCPMYVYMVYINKLDMISRQKANKSCLVYLVINCCCNRHCIKAIIDSLPDLFTNRLTKLGNTLTARTSNTAYIMYVYHIKGHYIIVYIHKMLHYYSHHVLVTFAQKFYCIIE